MYRYTIFQKGKHHKFFVDGYDVENKAAYEFFGDHWLEDPKVFRDQYLDEHDKTMARTAIIESHGSKVVEMWEHDLKTNKKGLGEWMGVGLEKLASMRRIRTRDALKGGRTEVFQM